MAQCEGGPRLPLLPCGGEGCGPMVAGLQPPIGCNIPEMTGAIPFQEKIRPNPKHGEILLAIAIHIQRIGARNAGDGRDISV